MVRRVFALTSAIVLAVCTTQAFAQAAPAGSYQQSCTNVRVRLAQVFADCSGPSGQRITSSTSILCRGDIGNVNGYLRCNGAAGTARPGLGNILAPRSIGLGGALPAGTYRQSCTNAHMRGTVLVADCKYSSGAVLRSSLDTRTCPAGTSIANDEGLVCKH
jgi:hypothetical protein